MIAREGLLFIFAGVFLTTILMLLAARFDSRLIFSAALISGVLTLFTVFFFRDPPRAIPTDGGAIVSAADGRIVAIDSVGFHPSLCTEAVRISVFLSIFDVHVNRMPVSGVVSRVQYTPGSFLAAFKPEASEVNERNEVCVETRDGHKVLFNQIAGVLARRIVCYAGVGDSVTLGDRYGLIRFGSRMDIIIPESSEISVALHDRVKGGETILGYLPTSPPTPDGNRSAERDSVDL